MAKEKMDFRAWQAEVKRSTAEKMISAIEGGMAPWDREVVSMPFNAVTGRPFNGLNLLLLNTTEFTDPRWCTFKQGVGQGWKHKKGSKPVVRINGYRDFDIKSDGQIEDEADAAMQGRAAAGKVSVRRLSYIKPIIEYNVAQFDGVPELMQSLPPAGADIADRFLEMSGVVIEHENGVVPNFDANRGVIVVKPEEAYSSREKYAADILYAAALWRIHEDISEETFETRSRRASRIDEYDINLRAHMASAIMAAEYGLPPVRHYTGEDIDAWVSRMRKNPNEVFYASAGASAICDFISRFAPIPDFMSGGDDVFDEPAEALFDGGDLEVVDERQNGNGRRTAP